MNSCKVESTKKLSKKLTQEFKKINLDIKQSKLLDLLSNFYGYKNFNTFKAIENNKNIRTSSCSLRCISKDNLKYRNILVELKAEDATMSFKHIKLININGFKSEMTGIYCVNFNDRIGGDTIIKDGQVVSVGGTPTNVVNKTISNLFIPFKNELSIFLSNKLKDISPLIIEKILSSILLREEVDVSDLEIFVFLDYFKITYKNKEYYLRKNDRFDELNIFPVMVNKDLKKYELNLNDIKSVMFDEFSQQFIINNIPFDIIKNYKVKKYSFSFKEKEYETITINKHLDLKIENINREHFANHFHDAFYYNWQEIAMQQDKLAYYPVGNIYTPFKQIGFSAADFSNPNVFILDQEQKIIEIIFITEKPHYYLIKQFSYI